MWDRIVGQMSPAAWMGIGLLAVIAGKQIEFLVLMLVGAAAATIGIWELLKGARQPE